MDLYFNKQEVNAKWGLIILMGAIDALLAPPSLKDLKTQSNTARHGVEPYNITNRKYDKRDFSMSFAQTADTLAELYTKQRQLQEFLMDGTITITSTDFQVSFRCALKSFTNYSVNVNKITATFSLTFTEYDPSNRTYEDPTA